MMHSRLRWLIMAAGLSVSVLGCYDYDVIHPTTQKDEFYWELKADHRAVLLSMTQPYNSLQLTVKPYNVEGGELSLDTLHEAPQTIWESADTLAVRVSQAGMITAEKVASRVNVYATMTIGDVTHRDTIWVGVTPTASSTLDSFVVSAPVGKNTVAAGGILALSARAKLANGQILEGVPVSYRSSNRWLADFKGAPGVLSGIAPVDSIYAYGTTTVYGVTRRDSVFLYTGLPLRVLTRVMTLEAQVSNNRKLIYVPRIMDPPSAPGSSFLWNNNSGVAPKNAVGFPAGGIVVDIIFDHPEFAEAYLPGNPMPLWGSSGNILQLHYDAEAGSTVAYRKFNQPGEYWYTIEPLGVRGKVTVGTR